MDFELNETEEMSRAAAERFARERIAPVVAEDDRTHRFQRDIISEMGENGFYGSAFPEELGGSEAGFSCHGLITEEISKVCSSLRATFNMQAMTCPYTIMEYGSPDQVKKYVPDLISARKLGMFALTEPHSGTDVAGMRSRAEKVDGGYKLTAAKTWISQATVFDYGVIFVKTDTAERKDGITAFILEKEFEGITVAEITPKLGNHCSPTGEVTLDEVFVPAENRLGDEGQGFEIAMRALLRGRLSVGAGGLGVARAALELAVEYAKERQAFGKSISSFQMIKDQIARMAVMVENSRLLVRQLGWQLDAGVYDKTRAAMAKYVACEAAVNVANMAAEVFGGYAYSEDYPIVRLLRDCKMYQIAEGTHNIQKVLIANGIMAELNAD